MENKINELKNFYIFSLGQFVSQFGSKLSSYGFILWAYKESNSVLTTSLLGACYLVPEIFFSFIAGGISDSWNKKSIIILSDTMAGFLSLLVLMLFSFDILEVKHLYIINFLLGIGDAFQNPASEVVISIIVSKENYIKTSGIRSFFNSFITIFVPICSVAIYSFSGLKYILIVDLLTFLFALLTLIFLVYIPEIKSLKEENINIFKQCIAGVKYIFYRKDILALIYFMGFINFIAGMYNTALAPMILSRTGNNDIQLGVVTSSIGISGLLGSLIVQKFPQPKKRVPLMANIMIFSFLICNILLGVGRNYIWWTIAVLAGHFFVPLLLANMEYFMRTKVPLEVQGKVFSARNTIQYATLPMGNLLCGILADNFFEPYMLGRGYGQEFFHYFTGEGSGSGLALMYIFLGLIGFIGSFLFKKNKNFNKLDQK
ncbi:MFS transporter [Fusobacterium mortiferum]|uniref:MFS transporter n=1 Tax=Fusobacterium mortiferum ATCC 9817 TaxID=469616 RepID=A0ABM6TY91_FUSMR|nr:MFS transporter [Fusobacterium mortiferum]AVQ19427.1 MFS transporter [Fusobacterium mortiferum ATCC 9817]EEO36167.1 transporter, major facilitator family protein [Fusobacterium mortiferum ATCC 9817]